MYYMNDGVYGSFASKLSEDLNTVPEVHKKYKEDEPLFTSSLWTQNTPGAFGYEIHGKKKFRDLKNQWTRRKLT